MIYYDFLKFIQQGPTLVLPFTSPPPTLSLGSANPRVIFILAPPPGQCLSKCWSELEHRAGPSLSNLGYVGSCMLRSSDVALRMRYVQLLSGFVGTSGGFAGLVLPLSKCLVNRDSESDRVFLGEGLFLR